MNTFKTTACVLSLATAGFAMDMSMSPGGGDDENSHPDRLNRRSAPSTPVKPKRSAAGVTTPSRNHQADPDYTTPVRQARVQQPVQERQIGVDNVRTLSLPGGTAAISLMAQVDAYTAANPGRTYTAAEQARLRFREDGSSYLEPEQPTVTSTHTINFSKEMAKLLKAYKSFSRFVSNVFSLKAFELLKNMKTTSASSSSSASALRTPDVRDVFQTPNAPERIRRNGESTSLLGVNQLCNNIGTPLDDDISTIYSGENMSENGDLDSEYGSVISGADDDGSVGLNTAFRLDFGLDEGDESEDGSVYNLEDSFGSSYDGSDSEDEDDGLNSNFLAQ